jgi:hypothetical protein
LEFTEPSRVFLGGTLLTYSRDSTLHTVLNSLAPKDQTMVAAL